MQGAGNLETRLVRPTCDDWREAVLFREKRLTPNRPVGYRRWGPS
jgi:hypothetical protein